MTKLLGNYQEQFGRVKRWYGLIKRVTQVEKMSSEEYSGEDSEFSIDEYFNRSLDYFYAFFMNCYHLKDWIKNDDTVKLGKDEVENFISDNKCMRLCADICNGIKHLEHHNRSEEDPKFVGKAASLDTEHGLIIRATFSIGVETGTIDAFQLASACVQAWEKFIKNKVE